MRSLLTAAALAATAIAGTVASPPATAAQYLSAQVCEAGGGVPAEHHESPTGFVCEGGTYDGQWVVLD